MDTMTLTELAQELRKIFDFKYMTYDPVFKIRMWKVKPEFRRPVYEYFFGSWRIPRGAVSRRDAALAETGGFGRSLIRPLDLSEYKEKEQLHIDYSKCIVEVSDVSK